MASTSEQRWGEVLRKAGIALQGRAVGVWEADRRGRLRPVAAGSEHQLPERAAGELEAALRGWRVERPAGKRWVASWLEPGRWCIAPVRYEPAGPPPRGVERRGSERMTLELAALGIGLIERPAPALHDPLTDLPNRVFFAERVGQALDRERREPGYRFAVGFLDLDEFKLVNDSLGHAAGDRLLADVAGRLRTCVRPGDVVARLGGDEFSLLLEFVATSAEAEHATLRIQRSLRAPFQVDGHEVFVTASIGVALSSEGYERAEDLLRDADIAMYRAKARGRANFQVFDITMRDRQARRLGLETDLRNALERGEFRVVFQPIVELVSGHVHGFEALLRWQHPQRGTIEPLEFIPLAEQTGLILPIGSWVLHEACRYARHWQRSHNRSVPIRISVNLSAKQLGHPRLLEDVRGSLREAGLDPRHLGLEITESVLMENVESATAMLEELRRLDVELQMDDFGTGYSSLSYLPHFPLQVIKIDGSFVRRMGTRRTNLELVRSIVDLARNLGMGVIAEGVETEEQRYRLLGFGCTLGQGFHFAAPMDPVSAGALLEQAAKKEPT